MKKEKIEDGVKTNVFADTADFWTFQLNNEIYLRRHPDVVRGSKEYFDIILSERKKFIYYFPSMIDFLKQSPSHDFLEIGCGMGTDTIVFEREGFNVTGIDLTPAHLALAEKLFSLYNSRGVFIKGNAEALPFDDNSFGCVYSFGVLHHTKNTNKAIDEIYRVLQPNGRAVLMLYHKWSLNNLAHFITGKGFENVKGGKDSPITYRLSKNEVKRMCLPFSECYIDTEYLFGAGWGILYDWIPKKIYYVLSKLMGWHLFVRLKK